LTKPFSTSYPGLMANRTSYALATRYSWLKLARYPNATLHPLLLVSLGLHILLSMSYQGLCYNCYPLATRES